MKNWVKFIFILSITIIIDFMVYLIFFTDINNRVNVIRLLSYDEEKNILKVEVQKETNLFFNYPFTCIAESIENTIKVEGKKNKCVLELPLESNYDISINNKFINGKKHKMLDYIENRLDFKFEKEEILLVVGEKSEINYNDKYIIPIDTIYEFISEDENIAKVEDGKIVAVGKGTTNIKEKESNASIKVVVTDLITIPTLAKEKKPIIPCNEYTEEEANMLDELLKKYVNEAGYGTRAGAVAAARFLTLQLKYRVPYFYENGRTNDSGTHMADGEGRYYKQGLYLSESKFSDIKYTYGGKAIWGCPLKNLQTNAKYGFIAGNKMPNGLDCSGFVSWALVNGGFDPGDVGAGENPGIYQLTDTGEFTTLTKDLALSGKIKTGDLFNFWGHIAIIIGQDDNNYYVAESLPHLGGVIATTYSKKTVAGHFEFVVFMDKFYKKDGNLTDYWQ